VTGNATYTAQFSASTNEYTVTASATTGGSVNGAGEYAYGTTATLTATADANYNFVNWTENGEIVSTDAIYTFTVEGDRTLVANFELATVDQTVTLTAGWNWFVPTVDTDLEALEAALGEYGLFIKTQTANISQEATYDGTEWIGDEFTLVQGQMYKIQVSNDCSITLTGMPSTSVSVDINPGINWIGFTGTQPVNVAQIFSASFDPQEGDVIKTTSENIMFENGEWIGDFETLQPGQGYVYISNDNKTKTLTFPGSKK
jgi:hypothetical protein